ncbi:cytochrome P450 313b1 [Haematobia irritans]|uniref:cytochrome P450 313b1 n=1 Tax=Haematobia irritans TaxID=7368 RepID=UPI003F4F7A09
MLFISSFLVSVLVLIVAYYLWTQRKFFKLCADLPGPGLPLIGMALEMLQPENFLQNLDDVRKQYQTPCATWMGHLCMLYVNEPETMEIIFNSPHCTNKGEFYRFLSDAIGDGLFTSSSPRWNKHRRLLNPVFARKVVQSFLPIFNSEANAFVNRVALSQGQPMEIYELLKKTVLEISCQTTMGKKMNFQNDSSTVIFEAYNGLIEIGIKRMLSPWLYMDTIYRRSNQYTEQKRTCKILSDFVESLLELEKPSGMAENAPITVSEKLNGINKRADTNDIDVIGKSKQHSFVEQVREYIQKGQLSVEDVLAEANVTVAATFETTSTALYFACLALAMHPNYQDKLYLELVEILPEGSSQDITMDHLEQMTYTEMVLNEAMRLFSPVPVVLREVSEDFKMCHRITGQTIVIPKGTQVALDIFNMQRNEEVWGEKARSFDPDEHFGPTSQRHPFAFVPFTKGLRMCIGYRYALMLMKIMLAKIFRTYRVVTKEHMEDLEIKGMISLKLGTYPLCIFERRDTKL